MKKILYFTFFLQILYAKNPFTKGVNLTNWFQTQSIYEINFTKFIREDFVYLQSIGCDVVRIPVNFQSMVDVRQNYKIDKYLLFLLDKVCNWAEELDLRIIIDNHPFRRDITHKNYDRILVPIWQQISEHFKHRSNLIYFEILNEPHGISNLE